MLKKIVMWTLKTVITPARVTTVLSTAVEWLNKKINKKLDDLKNR